MPAAAAAFPAAYLATGEFGHGYALTVRQPWGTTGKQAMLLGSDALYQGPATSGLPHGRRRGDLHLVAGLSTIPLGRTATPRGVPGPSSTMRSPPRGRRWPAADPKILRSQVILDKAGSGCRDRRLRSSEDDNAWPTAEGLPYEYAGEHHASAVEHRRAPR